MEGIRLSDKIEKIEAHAFDGCLNLKSVNLQNVNHVGADAFRRCVLLEANEQNDDGLTHPHSQATTAPLQAAPLQVKSIVLSSNSDVITQDDVESICSEENVKYKITIPDGIRQIDNDAFMCCKIEDIDIPESVREIGESAFNETGLSVFKCPKGITKIESGTYAGNNINVVVIPKHINYIGEYAFNANPIEKIIIKNPDCEICLGAFFIGDGLKELHLKNSIPPKNIVDWFWSDVPTDCRPEYFSDCVLYVPKGTAYLYYRHKEKPDYDLLDASWDYCNPFLFFKDIVEE